MLEWLHLDVMDSVWGECKEAEEIQRDSMTTILVTVKNGNMHIRGEAGRGVLELATAEHTMHQRNCDVVLLRGQGNGPIDTS